MSVTELSGARERPRPRALITGANRGLGLAIARGLAQRGHDLLLAVRDLQRGRKASLALARAGVNVRLLQLDLTCLDAHADVMATIAATPIDVLVNNAGVHAGAGVLESDLADYRLTMEVNLFAPLRLMQAVLPGMVERGRGRVVNLSSGSGSHGQGLPGPAPYSVSKAALNALTAKTAQTLPADVKVNAVCPGWVRTEMGGAQAPLSVREGADTAIWLATLPADGPNGGLFRFRRQLDW